MKLELRAASNFDEGLEPPLDVPLVDPNIFGMSFENNCRWAGKQAHIMPTCISIVLQYAAGT
jgi:hypothetical protein